MSRDFYRVVVGAFEAHENEGTLNITVRAFTQYTSDLGKLRQSLLSKAWRTHGSKPHGGTDFYPLLAEVGKERIMMASGIFGDIF